MFRKLKQKIETVETAGSPNKDASMSRRSDDGSRRSSAISGSHIRRVGNNMHRSDSMNSLSGSDVEVPTESSSREELHSMLLNRTTQLKRLEVKLAEYGQSLKERNRECEKLTGTLEKAQDNGLRKIDELNETYSNERLRYQSTIDRLEKTEKDLFSEKQKLEEENEKLKASVKEWETQKDDFEKKKNEFYEKRDNTEELEDLQKQELAKLKHMLINSEKESQRLQVELDAQVADLIQTRERNDFLEVKLRSSVDAYEKAEARVSQLSKDNENLLENKNADGTLIKKLTCDSGDLRDKLSCLALELQKTRSNYSSLESTHSNLSEKYESLKHSTEAVVTKTKADGEEKQSLIDHLREKLKLLEQRSNAEKLPQDEQMQAFLAERSALETRLEEARQQLVNIKSTWSGRINQLETQVSHLNSKIAEDSEEISQKSAELESLKASSKDQVTGLEKEIATLKELNVDLTSHNEAYLQQVAELEAKLIEQETLGDLERSKLTKQSADLENELLNQRKSHLVEIAKLDKQLQQADDNLTALQSDADSAKKDHEDELASLRSQIDSLQQNLTDKELEITGRERISSEMAISLEEVRCDRDEMKRKRQEAEDKEEASSAALRDARDEIENMNTELAALRTKLAEVEANLNESSSKLEASRDELQEKHEGLLEYQGSSKEKERELQALLTKVENLESSLESRTTELMSCKEEIASLKNNQAEEGEEVKDLRVERTRLEDRLLEKDRSLKLSQQRLVDVKKALQKELNKQQSGSNGRSRSIEASRGERKRSGSRTDGKHKAASSASATNGHETAQSRNGLAGPDVDPIPSVLAGDMSLDDPSLNDGQRDVVVKYLKHVVLRFLSCGQSESQQLVKAMSMILRFTADEEKLVREILDYRTSWFGSRPSTKNVIKPSVKGKGSGRHKR